MGRKKKEILIVGAGPAGLMASIFAAGEGARVTILEQNDDPLKKLLVTGNGRCNYSNAVFPQDAYRGGDPAFAGPSLAFLSPKGLIDYFRQELLMESCQIDGFIYPRSLSAKSVASRLLLKARELGVILKTRQKVEAVLKKGGRYLLKTPGWTYEGDALILASGSKASRVEGSDGSGYDLAASLGHPVTDLSPALTGLILKGEVPAWSGVRSFGRLSLLEDGELIAREEGELQLTDYGISGIPAFQLSSLVSKSLLKKKELTLSVNFCPDLPDLYERYERIALQKSGLSYRVFLEGYFPEKLARVLSKGERERLTDFRLPILKTCSFDRAQVCAGGLATGCFDPKSLESRLCPGLFACGEILDLDGRCGGYNLQWAFSSGALAGKSAAKGGKHDRD